MKLLFKKRLKRLSYGMTMVAFVTVLAACGKNAGKDTATNAKTINWYLPTDVSTLDISKNTDAYSTVPIGNSGGNLLRLDGKGGTRPDLAKDVEVSKDGLTYTATLRDGLKWSDGSDLTAKDFVYSWQRMVDPATASEYAYLVVDSHLKNADKINKGEEKDLNTLGVKAEGNKVIFTLTNPSPQFMDYLAFSNFLPQKEDFVKKAGKDYGTSSDNMLYSGPYKVEGWNGSNGDFKLVKNEKYWDAKNVKIQNVNVDIIKKPDTAVQMYKQGKLDFADISGTSAIYNANKNNKAAINVETARTAYMVYNQSGRVKALNNQKIRQALNLATDRSGIVGAAFDTGSKAATALVPTGLEKLSNGKDLTEVVAPGYKYDTSEAKKLFEEGLKEIGQTNLTLTITADSDSPANKNAIDYVKSAWEKALPGLTVNEKFVTFKQRLQDTKNQNFDVALVSWGGDYPEGSTFYGLFTSASAYNYGKFINADYDKVYNTAITENAMNKDEAAQNYKQAEKILYDNAAYTPVYFLTTKGLQNPDIKGIVRNSTGLTVDFVHAHK